MLAVAVELRGGWQVYRRAGAALSHLPDVADALGRLLALATRAAADRTHLDSTGSLCLTPRKAPGRALEVTPTWLAELRRVIDLDPHTVDVPSAVWTTRLLSTYLQRVTGHKSGIETVRVHLHR